MLLYRQHRAETRTNLHTLIGRAARIALGLRATALEVGITPGSNAATWIVGVYDNFLAAALAIDSDNSKLAAGETQHVSLPGVPCSASVGFHASMGGNFAKWLR